MRPTQFAYFYKNKGEIMKRIGMLLVLVSLTLFSVGCKKPADTAPATEEPAAEAPAGDEAAAPAAEGEAAAPAEGAATE